MSLAFPNVIPRAIVNTILAPLIPLLLPGAFGNVEEAQAAAVEMLLEYCPGTREELRLAGEVIGFGLQVLDALREAAEPGMPHVMVLRLRASATAMRRSEHAARRELEVLQRTRREAIADERNDRASPNAEPGSPAEAAMRSHPAASVAHPVAPAGAADANAGAGRTSWADILQATAEAARLEAAQVDATQADDAMWPHWNDDGAGGDREATGTPWATSGAPSERAMSLVHPDAASPAFDESSSASRHDARPAPG